MWSHLFRHSRATFLLANGMSEPRVKALLGQDPGSTMLSRYSHIASKDAHKSVLELNGLQAEKVGVERLHFGDDRLKPAVPTVALPGARPADLASL